MLRTESSDTPIVISERAGLPGSGPQITVVSAVGQGQTLLSSFDDALRRCGVHNYNLLCLSSIIPPGSRVVAAPRRAAAPDEFGHRLYVVKADARSATAGTVIAAGVGWLQWGDGRGIFVEHSAESSTLSCETVEAALREEISDSLQDLCDGRDLDFDAARVGARIAIARVGSRPTTALALAVYQAEGWR